jgi:hypothetical protein
MSRDRRLGFYAGFAAAHALVLLAVVLAPGRPGWAAAALGVSALPFLFAWGHYHVDLATNAGIREPERDRWRILFYLLPWSMALYWLRWVRPRRAS